jgi:hypothetical protein
MPTNTKTVTVTSGFGRSSSWLCDDPTINSAAVTRASAGLSQPARRAPAVLPSSGS